MNKMRVLAIASAALVLGLVAGSIGIASAVPSDTGTATAGPAAGYGLRLGSALKAAGGRLADVVASLTKKDVDAVVAERQAGKSFADIAESSGVDSGTVVDQALAKRKALLDERVKAGQLTQAQADEVLARMKARLTDRVDDTGAGCTGAGPGSGGGCGMGGGRGAGGCGGGGCGAAGAAQ